MYRKNTAGQFIHFQGVDATTGGIKSGVTWTMRRCLDGTFAAGGGTVTEDGTTGWYKCALAQADTNGNNCAANFTGTGAVPQTVNFLTDGSPPDINVKNLLGTAWLTPGTAGTPDVNVKLWNGLTTVALPLVPTVAGRTLDCSAGGEAGVDWANVGSPTTALALTGTTIATTQKVDIETIKTNPVVNAGTVTFPTNATLASTTNLTAGTIATVSGNVNGSVGSVTGLTASNLDATVSSRLASASYTAPDSAATIAAAVWATVIDGTNSAIKLMRGMAAALLGKASGLATTSAVYRDAPDSKDVITATVDADGNRTAVTLNLT